MSLCTLHPEGYAGGSQAVMAPRSMRGDCIWGFSLVYFKGSGWQSQGFCLLLPVWRRPRGNHGHVNNDPAESCLLSLDLVRPRGPGSVPTEDCVEPPLSPA